MSLNKPKPRVLVTSAAGHTGAAAVRSLLERGFPVRAFVRRDDARAEALRRAGADIFVGDLFDYRDLQRALTDVQRAYHCPPSVRTSCTGRCSSPSQPRRRSSRWSP